MLVLLKQILVLYSPVFLLLRQIGLVDLLVLYFLILVILLGCRGGAPRARGGAANVFCAVELVNATGEQHAVAVQLHGAFGASLSTKTVPVLLHKS